MAGLAQWRTPRSASGYMSGRLFHSGASVVQANLDAEHDLPGTLTSVSDGKGHAGKVLQHSHAGGYELLLLYSHLINKGYSYSSFGFGFGFHACLQRPL